ncbi:MAG TPA: transglutaminase domain-containing protein [Thermoanaerobaculia bacterium]|nr:transglutaminase domain-containing protein [Thermoanaerobaculia bacterium]
MEYLEPNALIEAAHPEIVKIAAEIAGTAPDAYRPALALTKWTAENMKMDAGIVMAPASELIRERKATCVGYATLLASRARIARARIEPAT